MQNILSEIDTNSKSFKILLVLMCYKMQDTSACRQTILP